MSSTIRWEMVQRGDRICVDCGEPCRDCGEPRGGKEWEADHVLPVWEGGGGCGLDGFEMRCVECHRAKTSANATRRAQRVAS